MSWPEAFVAAVGILAAVACIPLTVVAVRYLEKGRGK